MLFVGTVIHWSFGQQNAIFFLSHKTKFSAILFLFILSQINLRIHFVIDPDDNNDFFHLQSKKGGAQRTSACQKWETPKRAPLNGLILICHRHVTLWKRHVPGAFDASRFDSEFYYILLSAEWRSILWAKLPKRPVVLKGPVDHCIWYTNS